MFEKIGVDNLFEKIGVDNLFEWKTIIKVAAAAGLVTFAVKLSAGLAKVLIEYPIWRGWLGGL